MTSTLRNHPIWQDLNHTLRQLDPQQIAQQHLQDCQMQINGYWDEDKFYDIVSFTEPLSAKLSSGAWGISSLDYPHNHWLQLKFMLTIDPAIKSSVETTIGELVLILSDDLDVIDENWLIDIHSPYVIALSE